jgi:hypothetical protein
MSRMHLSVAIDGLRYRCRIRDLDFFDPSAAGERVARIAATIERLGTGRFVFGLGPYCSEMVRLGQHPIRLGRHAGPLEEAHEDIIDYSVNDASLHGPREVSRLHCTLDPGGTHGDTVNVIDEGSSTGTWIYPSMERLEPRVAHRLPSGGLFSLGPSGTNLFLFVNI